MKEGSGLGLYGIEVAKHLKLPDKVLHDAYSIRNKYYNSPDKPSICNLKSSRYNANVIMSTCKVQGCTSKATQTHHIRHQAAGTTIDGVHKNHSENLVPLCDKHHDMTHGKHGDKILVIFGFNIDNSLDYKFRNKISSLL